MIKLFDGYYINANELDYSLCFGEPEKTIRKDGSSGERHNVIGYYGSVTKAVKAFRQELYRNCVRSRSLSLVEAVQAFQEINTRVEKLLSDIEA